ncbi:argininosuccinate synthase [Candidatus Woesearchaeota archaeon]|nr:argininosuccinate synthase [Candidatus Woesearchaeota archaeon]|tara:strand:- start:2053 stop:3267 length:1215 start_codon:yes stop_codon:yes gene_type:complete
MQNKKVVLAYSGGLDTSVILKWLINQEYEVICFIADVGQEDDFKKAKAKALSIGASKVYIEDLKKEFVENYIFQALKANAVYEGKYLLGTSLPRPLIAKKQIEIANKENTNIVSHGATSKGNDQVRFELTYMKLMPDVKIISPWKDSEFIKQFKGRSDLLNYAKENNIQVEATSKKPYSMDDNIMHISYEAGQLEDPAFEPTQGMFKKTTSPKDAPDKETKIMIEFKAGIPVKIDNLSKNKAVTGPLELFQYLNELGSKNGIGRIDLVENRFVGMKSRGVYETPAGTILLKAHLDIEGLVLDKEVGHLKDMLMPKIAELIYNGFWFSPEMEFLMAAVNKSQENVDGKVYMTLYKGNVFVTGRESKKSLYNEDIASMDKLGGYDQTDAKGFIKLNALRLKLGAKK